MTILVTGARGNLARVVIAQLVANGERVRAASRNPAEAEPSANVEPILLDFARSETFGAALEGVDRVFMYAATEGVDDFVAAVREAGVRKIVLLSSAAVAMDDQSVSEMAAGHAVAERAVAGSGINWVMVRPAMFATNALWWKESIRDEAVVRVPYPDSYVNPIHDADIADVATLGLISDKLDEQRVLIDGPEPLTQRQQVALISEAIGRELRVEELPPEVAARSLPRGLVDGLATGGSTVPFGPSSQAATGKPARDFGRWAMDHAADFQ